MMKLEFYALFLFIVTVTIFFFITFQKKVIIVEEVLPSPLVFVKNPFEKILRDRINQINFQLLFLEYNLKVPRDISDSRTLENLLEMVNDPRAVKKIIKRVRKYWWGCGIEEIALKIKHIKIVWRPEVYIDNSSNKSFGDALYEALNGRNTSFNLGSFDISLVKLIAERYGTIVEGK
ncbi:MAG TPA: hypothetical protein DE117_04290 [Fervidobacterium sp.]|nr:hypothetical protein [Fervidobacterium sp.]